MTTFIKIGATDYNAADYTVTGYRQFREAWQVDTDTAVISVNLEKAKEIWRDKIRQDRKDKLAALDTAYMRALEAGSDTTQIVADKQVLRDAPSHPDIAAATTVEELVEVQPIPNHSIG